MDEIPKGGRRPAIVVVVPGRLEGRPGGIGLPVSHRRVKGYSQDGQSKMGRKVWKRGGTRKGRDL